MVDSGHQTLHDGRQPMPHPYTEDQLVERPAIQLCSTMSWRTVSAAEETLGPNGTLGRDTSATERLAGAIFRIGRAEFSLHSSSPPAIEKLCQTRDLLLPRLLSGQVPFDSC